MIPCERLIYAVAFTAALQRVVKEGRTKHGLDALNEAAHAVSVFRHAVQDMGNYDVLSDATKNMALAFLAATK